MSSIQKILNTDKFKDLVDKINEVIDYCDGTLTQSVKNAFRLIRSNTVKIKELEEEIKRLKVIVGDTEVGSDAYNALVVVTDEESDK